MKKAIFATASVMTILLSMHATAATEKLTVESVSEGPDLIARKALLQEIIQAEKRGIGVSPYVKAFTEIDNLAKSGGSADQITTRTKALHSALERQLTTKVTIATGATKVSASTGASVKPIYSSSASPVTLNAYIDSICNYLQNSWTAVPGMRNDVNLKVFVGATGGINRVELDNDQEDTSESIRQQVLTEMKTLKLPERPPRELSLSVTISPQAKDISVGVADIDSATYMRNVQARVKRAWFPPRRSKTVSVVVLFKLNRAGTLLSCEMHPPSGDFNLDQAAMRAVRNASPFLSAPDGMPSTIPISFTFDYKAHEN